MFGPALWSAGEVHVGEVGEGGVGHPGSCLSIEPVVNVQDNEKGVEWSVQ